MAWFTDFAVIDAVRKRRKLLISRDGGGGWELPWKKIETESKLVQLYNLKDDPSESKNLEDAQPEIVNELVNDLAQAIRDGRTTPGAEQANEGWPYRDGATKVRFPQLQE
jgi:hypothetical protein